jgi:hypothetical protein
MHPYSLSHSLDDLVALFRIQTGQRVSPVAIESAL